jgi:hypothetical protein
MAAAAADEGKEDGASQLTRAQHTREKGEKRSNSEQVHTAFPIHFSLHFLFFGMKMTSLTGWGDVTTTRGGIDSSAPP